MYLDLNMDMRKNFSWFIIRVLAEYDHIFCTSNMRVDNVFYDQEPRTRKISDHSPLIAELIMS